MKSSSVGGTEREMAIISLGRCCVLKWLVSNGSLFGRQFIDDGPLDFCFFKSSGRDISFFIPFPIPLFYFLFFIFYFGFIEILKLKNNLPC